MGGLGALTSYLRCPDIYKSVSAFAPISNPSIAEPWGRNAFQKLLGSIEGGKDYDPTLLVKNFNGTKKPLMVYQGSADKFLADGLQTDNFIQACREANHPV